MKTEDPVTEKIPPSDFISRLVDINHLAALGFERFIFFPGMLFNSMEKWWGRSGLRPASHEGLDLCFFAGKGGAKFRLDETVRVPMVYDGIIAHMMDDFLGKTVVTRHDFGNAGNGPVLSLYGHVHPDPHLKIGDRICRGDVFASIADTFGRSRLLPPHLHISFAKAWMLPQAGELTWEMLNRADRAVFIDPMNALGADYSVIYYDGAVNLFESYQKFSRVKQSADS
ncbi:MAG: hypothetical protein Q7U02_09745 [Desulfosalsimonadaceae bacterium]|nr:hypothetical protein [Desulfosalsimonadaceae bacterium]